MKYPDTTFQRWLEENEAYPFIRVWVADQSPEQFWATCERSNWMLWLYSRCNADPRTSVQLALIFAERVEHLMDSDSKECLRLVRKWLNNPESVSAKELRDASFDANAYTFVAENNAASLVALAAEYAVNADADSDADNYITKRAAGLCAASSCQSAALHAASAIASTVTAHAIVLKTQADIIRQYVPICPLTL